MRAVGPTAQSLGDVSFEELFERVSAKDEPCQTTYAVNGRSTLGRDPARGNDEHLTLDGCTEIVGCLSAERSLLRNNQYFIAS